MFDRTDSNSSRLELLVDIRLAQELSSARKSLLESDLISKSNRRALYLCVRARRWSDRQAVCTDGFVSARASI
ncbi:hypothetical protein F2Q69_00037147 [Brassica cretica]|uniref:Uncharacterized protein n=1 Tax=Brassica cretica TaxID=69181 RepID=A0A8S9SIQ1_BRACR|nr:hypothetical protein F2Q69_00037147 [Brassica cretica]